MCYAKLIPYYSKFLQYSFLKNSTLPDKESSEELDPPPGCCR